jgi:cytochrome oxidase Cu insertion factor (SCO1/SenC/PrrC family)
VEDRLMNGRAAARGFDREQAQALAGLVALFVITAAWWALALWPMAGAPVWLERTRYVCFGVSENGLPDGGGWIGLIGGPSGMLLILVVGWNGGLRSLMNSARTSRTIAALLSALVIGSTLLITGAAVRVQQVRTATAWIETDNSIPSDKYPRLDRAAPALALTAQSGEVVDLADFRGQPVLVTFAFAHCRTLCPLTVTHALRAREQLRGSPYEPVLLIVTLDPWRDRPSRLPAMASTWGLPADGAWVLSGSVQDVEAVLDGWNVPRSRDPSTGDVTHPSLLYIVDRDGRLAYAATGGVQAIVSLVRRL